MQSIKDKLHPKQCSMENDCHLVISQIEFENKIDKCREEGEKLLDQPITTEKHLEDYKTAINDWNSRALSILTSSFSQSKNDYVSDFKNIGQNPFRVQGAKYPINQLAEFKKSSLKIKLSVLQNILKILSISDTVINNPRVDIRERMQYSVADISNLLLNKLHLLYSDDYYSISRILSGNGIRLKRAGDNLELSNILAEEGLVETLGGSHGADVFIRLSLKGVRFVEERKRAFLENYDEISKSDETISSRIDEILNHLKNQGLENERIREELDELKILSKTMGKKTWIQVLKGKLVDLALAKLIEKDTLNYIYHALTNHGFRLPWP